MQRIQASSKSIVRSIFEWCILLVMAALLVFAHPFRYQDFVFTPNLASILALSFALATLIYQICKPERRRARFLRGFFAGFVFFLGVLYWIPTAVRTFGEVPLAFAILGLVLLAAYCAIYWGVFALVAGTKTIQDRPIHLRITIMASLWAGLEVLREYLFTGFSWGGLGFSLVHVEWLGRSAAIWGVHGLSFIWIAYSLVWMFLVTDRQALFRDLSAKRTLTASVFFILVLVLVNELYLRSWYRDVTILRVGLIQPNIAQSVKWDPASAYDHLERLTTLTEQARQNQSDLVVWPETAYPAAMGAQQTQLAIQSSVPLLMGAVVQDRQFNRNSALMVHQDRVVGRYDKIHLVPFGEYVPLQSILSFGKLVANAGDFAPGSIDQSLLSLPEKKIEIGPLICYEDIFSYLSVAHVKKGASLLVNLTNDAWYGKSSAHSQHAALARGQVFATGRPMVRSTNDGQSGVMTPFKAEWADPYEMSAKVFEVQIPNTTHQTIFVMLHPFIQWIWWVIFVTALIWKERSSNRYQRRKIFSQN